MIIKKYFRLSFRRKWLLVEAEAALVLSRLLVCFLPFRIIVVLLGLRQAQTPTHIEPEQRSPDPSSGDIAWAIGATAHRNLWDSNCLIQALAGALILRTRHQPCEVFLGVEKEPHGKLAAHAWLCCGNQVVLGERGMERFTIVSSFLYSPNRK